MDWLVGATAHVERVFRAARQMTSDDDAAWDCVQEAFATALERAPEPDDPVAWLCGVARNHARHYVRARSRWTAALRRLADRPRRRPPEPPHDLHDVLGRLPLKLRDAVTLRYLAGMTAAEVARAQGISETAAKARVRRGLARLRHLLGGAALAALLAREAVAAHGKTAALKEAALRAPLTGLVAKKWAVALFALLGVAGTALLWRAPRGTAPPRDAEARAQADAPGNEPVDRGVITPEDDPGDSPPRYPADRASVTLKGRVVDHLRRPVADARVRIRTDRGGMRPYWTIEDDRTPATPALTTDARGEFAAEVPAGPYRLVARARGLRTQQRIVAGEVPAPVELVLPERGKALVVTVVDTAGAVVPGARVEILAGVPGEGVRTHDGTTDETGTYVLQEAWFENALVHARTEDGRAGWRSDGRMIHERPGAPLFVTVAALGSLAGRLVGVAPDLVEGARLTAWALTSTHPYWGTLGTSRATTVADGRYRFDPLASGSYVLTLDAPQGVRLVTGPYILWGKPIGNSAAAVVAEVGAGAAAVRDLDVAPSAILEGVVTREDGTPVPAALVRVILVPRASNLAGEFVHGAPVWRLDGAPEAFIDHPTTNWRARTDADGRYRFAGLPPGDFRVEVFAAGLGLDRREEIAVAEGRTTRLEHRLAPAGVLQLALPGGGVHYLGVVPAGSDRPILLARPPIHDTLTLPGLPAGRYRLGAFSSDPARGMTIDLGEVEVEAGRTTWRDLRHAGPYVIRGHVTDPAGPVAGLRVLSYGAGAVETDARGAFELRSIVRFPRGISVEVEEGPFRQGFAFAVGDDKLTVCEIALGGHTLTVRAQDAAGEPAPVELTVRGSVRGFRPAHLSLEGELAILHLRPGVYSVSAYFPGGGRAGQEVAVPETRRVVLREPPTGRLELRVVGAAPGVAVEAHASRPDQELGNSKATVGPDGLVIFASLPAGTINLSLAWQDRSNEEHPIYFRMNNGESSRFHDVALAPGATLRLRLVVDR